MHIFGPPSTQNSYLKTSNQFVYILIVSILKRFYENLDLYFILKIKNIINCMVSFPTISFNSSTLILSSYAQYDLMSKKYYCKNLKLNIRL